MSIYWELVVLVILAVGAYLVIQEARKKSLAHRNESKESKEIRAACHCHSSSEEEEPECGVAAKRKTRN